MSIPAQAKRQTRTITAASFKSRCLQLMDEVHETASTFVITKRGKPVAQLTALPQPEAVVFRPLFGRSPQAQTPSAKEWAKMKAEWAREWDASQEKLIKNLGLADGRARKRA